MSPQTNEPSTVHPMPSDDRPREASAEPPQSHPRSNGGLDRLTDKMSEGRMSGELEGSTLGSSSRDGDRSGGRGHQRRTASSGGGFLLDSSFLPRSKTSRVGSHRPRRSEPDRREKRAATEPDVPAPKKKSRFPWSRSKHSAGSSSLDAAVPSSSTGVRESVHDPGSSHQVGEPSERDATADTGQAATGLDSDSIQIVNLALNLSESRRRGNIGRSGSSRLSGGKLPAYGDTHAGSAGDYPSHARRTFTQPLAHDDFKPPESQQQGETREQPSVLDLIPDANDGHGVPFKASENTLARAENARRHFELFAQYLRLLPSLPPLKSRASDTAAEPPSATNDDASPCRAYNPLQAIRNRKVRFREKRSINTEAEGWNDVEKVHRWIDDVETQSGRQNHSSLACLELPAFCTEGRPLPGEADDLDLLTVSPPSSLRHVSRVSSAKTPRPRLDWIISPAELLCDAAWVEDGQNKSKIIDKDGNPIYPDPAELVSGNASLDITKPQKRSRLSKDRSIGQRFSSTAHSESRPSMDLDSKVSRGRRQQRVSSPPNAIHSGSISTRGTGLKQDKQQRSRSLSSDSSMSDSYSGSNTRVDREKSPERRVPGLLSPHMSRAKRSGEDQEESSKILSPIDTGASSHQAKKPVGRTKSHEPKASLSSGASMDDPYSPRMSLEAADNSPANSPPHAGYFPSITVNLSPSSSRSPSPSKRPFSRMMTPRHERSKSKNKKEIRDQGDEGPLHSEAVNKTGLQDRPAENHSGKLEPSPLPDRVSSSYQEGQLPSELERMYNVRSQKGQPAQDSKLRGLFKGRGKIAGIVGNEVSRVGDRILKKDAPTHSRKSSAAESIASSDSDMDLDAEEAKTESKPTPRAFLRRLPTFSDDSTRMSRGNSEKGAAAKASAPSLPTFNSSFRGDEEGNHAGASGLDSLDERGPGSRAYDAGGSQGKLPSLPASQKAGPDAHAPADRSDENVASSPSPQRVHDRAKGGQMRDPSVPFSLTRPPVTGLAQAKASPGPSSRERDQRHRMSEASRSWSISDRSLSALADSGIPKNREIERTRVLLLSSGIKAREITRRAETVRDPPPEFLRTSVGPNDTVPRVPRLHEFDLAAQNLLEGFERSQYLFQQSMDRFPAATSSPLRSQLNSLEILANQTLSPRVRAVGDDAEDLSVQLHTTSPLAVKQLSDALDRGVRKRHRRLRWIRRAGFAVLEWALVGVLWWVWLIVMVFKLFRGVLRGAVSGVRWILWL